MNGVSIYDLRADGYLVNQYIPVSASEKVIEAFEREKAEVFLYRFNDEVLTCYYTKVTTRVMQSFAEVRRNRYNKPYVQCADLLDAADGRTIYYTALDEHEKLLPVKNAIDSIDGVDYAFYEDTYTGGGRIRR